MVALAGIAKPAGFLSHLDGSYRVCEKLVFSDHPNFSGRDIEQLKSKLDKPGRVLITTEKDAVRLGKLPAELRAKCWFIPIELKVLFNEEKQFENRIRNYVRNYSNNS